MTKKKIVRLAILLGLLTGISLGMSGCVTKFLPAVASDGYVIGMDVPYFLGIAPAGSGPITKKRISDIKDTRE